jgi:hypothetical protein
MELTGASGRRSCIKEIRVAAGPRSAPRPSPVHPVQDTFRPVPGPQAPSAGTCASTACTRAAAAASAPLYSRRTVRRCGSPAAAAAISSAPSLPRSAQLPTVIQAQILSLNITSLYESDELKFRCRLRLTQSLRVAVGTTTLTNGGNVPNSELTLDIVKCRE